MHRHGSVFEKAIELDPKYAESACVAGWTYFLDWFYRLEQRPRANRGAGF